MNSNFISLLLNDLISFKLKQIRKLLANECDLIYECKACRNIFRSLGNYISHKRIYCKTKFNSAHHFHFRDTHGTGGIGGGWEQDLSTIIQADLLEATAAAGPRVPVVNGGHVGGGANKPTKDLGSIISRLLRKEELNRAMNLSDYYDQAERKVAVEKALQTQPVLQLETVANSKMAVFQTVRESVVDATVTAGDSIKREVNEVHDLMRKDCIELGVDGKVKPPPSSSSSTDNKVQLIAVQKSTSMTVANTDEEGQKKCDICSATFVTEKMLKLHIKAKHIASTFVFPCQFCSETFLKPSAVIRHLINDHK